MTLQEKLHAVQAEVLRWRPAIVSLQECPEAALLLVRRECTTWSVPWEATRNLFTSTSGKT